MSSAFLTKKDRLELEEQIKEVGDSLENGEDGFSPIVNVAQTEDGSVISITDKNKTSTVIVHNGKDGKDGKDGSSPTIGLTRTADGVIIAFKNADGSIGAASIHDGKDAGGNVDLTGYATEEFVINKLAEFATSAVRIAEINLLASKWIGDTSPYSQIVTIPNITEYSQVDLTPSVEQLSIFHDKDLAFVTENEDCVVTVYAIGDKPTNDYTMQVTIKEVSV